MAILGIPPLALIGIAVIGFIAYRVQQWTQDRKKLPLPPQPPGLPVIGNMLDVLRESKIGQQHILFGKWARDYGEITRVQVGPFTQYMLNSDAAVKELFDRQSATTSERPRWIVSNEQICNEKNVLLLNASSPRWKLHRKVTLQGMTSVARADAGLPYLHFETAKFLHEVANDTALASDSVGLFNSIGRYTYSAFASQTFGMDVPTASNPAIDYIYQSGLDQILGTLPGYYVVDMLPILDKLPLFLKPWERKARALHKSNLQWCVERMQRVQAAITKGTAPDSVVSRIIKDDKHMGFSDLEEAAYLCFSLIMGAADTSKMSTWSFLEAMLRFPSVQEQALAEIEAVVGVADRLPVYEDLDKIPYVRYLMKEVWRWRPPVALGHPHTTTKELTYKGYRLPKHSRIHLNAWAIHYDPTRYYDPESFSPLRYKGDLTTSEESKNSPDVKDRDHFAFGSGRRICPGYHVAERSLAIAIMRLIWAFEVSVKDGAHLLGPEAYPGEMPGNPGEHMPVQLKLRSLAKKKVIDEEYARAVKERDPIEPIM